MIVIECDDVIALCLAPSTERFLHSDDDHESQVGQDSQAAQAGQEDGGDSLLLSIGWLEDYDQVSSTFGSRGRGRRVEWDCFVGEFE